jgi:hypothetical protein
MPYTRRRVDASDLRPATAAPDCATLETVVVLWWWSERLALRSVLRAHFIAQLHRAVELDALGDCPDCSLDELPPISSPRLNFLLDFLTPHLEPVPFRSLRDHDLVDLLTGADVLTPLGRLYFRAWLRAHGIDPDTGRLSPSDV